MAEAIQPGLFDEPSGPVWKDPSAEKHTDFIADEALVIYFYEIEVLEKVHDVYVVPVFSVLLKALQALSRHSSKRLRERAFSLFAGDAGPGYSLFAVGISSEDPKLIEFLGPPLKRVDGYTFMEAGSSYSLLPKYRYDHGYVIEYNEPDVAGTHIIDGPDNYGSNLTLYRRAWAPADLIGKSRSAYGKLQT